MLCGFYKSYNIAPYHIAYHDMFISNVVLPYLILLLLCTMLSHVTLHCFTSYYITSLYCVMIPIGKIKKNEIKVKDKLDNMKLNKRNHGGNYSYVEIKIKKTKK